MCRVMDGADCMTTAMHVITAKAVFDSVGAAMVSAGACSAASGSSSGCS